ncbi:MAG: tripartite tricarboxylate transporter substrate binding protein BugD [Comamonadaceae bacterium]|nr:MAG: tripartite tricarboxylate transporter substrate binding protein BugD [Comamonadaceae bacterium]
MTTTRIARHMALTVGAAALSMAVAGQVLAADFPTRPITLVVPFAAGGPTDIVARSLGASMSKDLGQTIVIENRLGAGGTIAAGSVAKASPDGYTLLIHHNGMATAPALYPNLAYKPVSDFEYIGQVADVPMTLLGSKAFEPNTAKELIEYVKKNGDKVNLANAGPGAVSQLCGVLFEQATQTRLNAIPYQGTAPALNALLGNQVDLLCDQTTTTLPHIAAKSVKFYGVTTPERIKALPDAPTLQEQGLKGFDMKVWHGVYAPKGTPAPVVKRLTQSLQAALKDPEVVARMDKLGVEIVPVDKQTSEGLKTWLESESNKWQPLLKAIVVN